MYYNRRPCRYRSYHAHHSDSKLQSNFSPIVDDLKQCFFSLTPNTLRNLLLHYKYKYGQSAYDYAIITYPNWKNHATKLSDQTLLRLIETLPPFIEEYQRIELLKKLFAYHTPETYNNVYVEMTWENYLNAIDNVIEDIKYKYPKTYQHTQLPSDVLIIANWLCNDDMLIAKKILDDYSYNKYQLTSVAAIDDLLLFRKTCSNLCRYEKIYDEITLHINLSTTNIHIIVTKKEKSLLKYIKDIFS